LDIYKEYLLQSKIGESQIVSVNLEDLQYNFITDYMALYNYIVNQLQGDKNYYVFIDEVQKISDFQKCGCIYYWF